MTHGFRKLLAIHIADTHLLVAEGRKREGRLQITSLKEVPLDPQNPYEALYSRLKPYKNASVRVALPTQDVTHHFLSLPPLRRKDAILVVRRELEQSISLDLQGLSLDFIIPKGEEESCEYAVLTTQKKAVLSVVSEIQRAGKKPAFMTSPPFGLMAAARNILPDFGNSTCASLHLEGTRGLISIFRNGYLTFTRGFALTRRGTSGPEKTLEEAVSPLETGDMLTARLVQETNRSLLFFKQYSHGLVVQSLLISGKIHNPEALRDITAEELGITTYLFQPSEAQGPDKISVPAAVAPRDLIKFAVPVGLMALSPEDAANLVPESVLKKGRFFWSRVLVAIFCLALVLGMGRAVGETMAVLMTTGHAVNIPVDGEFPFVHILQSVQTMTATIASELGDAPRIQAFPDGTYPPEAFHYQALFVLGIVLFAITFVINLVADLLVKGIRQK